MVLLNEYNLLVCDSGNRVIRCVDFEHGIVSTLCGQYMAPKKDSVVQTRDGPFSECILGYPKKMCFHQPTGLLFVSECLTNTLPSTGKIRVLNVKQKTAATFVLPTDQSNSVASLQCPMGISCKFVSSVEQSALDLFVADCAQHCIFRFTINTRQLLAVQVKWWNTTTSTN